LELYCTAKTLPKLHFAYNNPDGRNYRRTPTNTSTQLQLGGPSVGYYITMILLKEVRDIGKTVMSSDVLVRVR
jgi:hypothetical protein